MAVRGWIAVALSTLIAGFWAFWGIIENFHEGWYYRSFAKNIGLMFVQYLLPSVVFVAAAIIAIYWPRIGALLHVTAAITAASFFRRGTGPMIIIIPLLVIAACYWFGRVRPRRRAIAIVVGVPLLVILIAGAEPAYRVAHRRHGTPAAVRIRQNGVDLIWAPPGPGWPDQGVTWFEAMRRCHYLSADGTAVLTTPQNIWRLPTSNEATRSMKRKPDKEWPLWDTYSKVIYWWTATEIDANRAYVVVYNGYVSPRPKTARWGYLGFRAVKNVTDAPR